MREPRGEFALAVMCVFILHCFRRRVFPVFIPVYDQSKIRTNNPIVPSIALRCQWIRP